MKDSSNKVEAIVSDAPRYIILLGAPGAGKGTQADLLRARLGLAHVASGDLFRENVAKQTPLGQLAKTFMDKGELVPDEITIQMVMERIARDDCARGVIFDGFPRTQAQARALDAALAQAGKHINAVIYIRVPDAVLVERLSARWSCPTCGAVYNQLTHPPRIAGQCDKDHSALTQRDDDKPETVRRRLQVYHQQTAPLIEYYQRAGVLREVDGVQPIEQVTTALTQIVQTTL
jgi:adenylate kinase